MPAPADEAAPDAEDSVERIVLAAVARASAYPLEALDPSMELMDQLGFDSMMLADLTERLPSLHAR